MRHLTSILFFALLFLPYSGYGYSSTPTDFSLEPPTLVQRGPLSVFQKGKDIYLAIPSQLIGREIEIRAQINKGFDMVARPTKSLGVVRLIEKDQGRSICLHQEMYSERIISTTDPKLQQAFELSNMPSSSKCYKVEYTLPEYGRLINISEDLLRGKEWFDYAQYPNIRQIDPELSSLTQVLAHPQGISLKINRMHGYTIDRDKQISYIMNLPQGTMPLEIECTLSILPERDMPIRLATHRSAPHTIKCIDYGQVPQSSVKDSILIRWDLSATKSPIMFYIDRHFPSEYIPAIHRAVSYWNKAFARAGLPTPLRIGDAQQLSSIATPRAFIAYDLVRSGIEEHLSWHPRTGEILSCRINVGHGFMVDLLDDDLLTHPQPQGRKGSKGKTRAAKIFEDELIPRLGHLLGVYQPDDIAWSYRCYDEAKDPYQDRDKGLSIYGRQSGKGITTPLEVHTQKLGQVSSAVAQLDRLISDQDRRQHLSVATRLYTRAYKIYVQEIGYILGHISMYDIPTQDKAIKALKTYLFSGQDPMQAPYLAHLSGSRQWKLREPHLRQIFRQMDDLIQDGALSIEQVEVLTLALFNNFDPTHKPSQYHMDLQLLLVNTMLDGRHQSPALLPILRDMASKLSNTSPTSDTELYYEYLATLIKKKTLMSR